MSKVAAILLVIVASGCSSSGRQLGAVSDDFVPEDVALIVRNEAPDAVSVFVWWESGRRVRLGELRGNSNRTFRTEHVDTGLYLSVDVLSQRTVGRGDAPRTFIPVSPGDRIEWTIRRTNRFELFWRRLEPM